MYAIEHEGFSDEPGTELVDIAAELALTDTEARSWLDAPSHTVTPDLARLTGHASDYEWAGWLADVLREAGIYVVEYPGWKTRGRPRSVGPFTPRGVIWHHDASPKGPSPSLARFIAEQGRPSEGIPAPLSQIWVCAGCRGLHPVGTWHLLAAGRANHAGIGSGWGPIRKDMGTTLTLGIETDNTTGEKTPAAMYESLVVGTAAVLRHLRSDPEKWLCGHKEYAAGRKIDPDDIDMDQARFDVARELVGVRDPEERQLVPFPSGGHFTPGHDCVHGHVRLLEQWLLQLDVNARDKHEPRRVFSRWTRKRVRAFQLSDPVLMGDPDGIPGPRTWRRLQIAARRQGGGAVPTKWGSEKAAHLFASADTLMPITRPGTPDEQGRS